MTHFFVKAQGNRAVCTGHRGILTAGMTGAGVTLTLDEAWTGLSVTAVFRCGSATVDVPVEGATVPVPAGVLQPEECLYLGLYGTDGEAVILPGVWVPLQTVAPAADPSGDPAADPELPIWASLQSRVEALEAAPGDPQAVAAAVESYLEENPVETGATEEEAAQLAQNTAAITTLTGLSQTHEEAIAANADGIATLSDAMQDNREAIEAGVKNPCALTFTGAVTAEYDGSEAVSVEIPAGGSGEVCDLLMDVTTTERVAAVSQAIDNVAYQHIYAIAEKVCGHADNSTSAPNLTVTLTNADGYAASTQAGLAVAQNTTPLYAKYMIHLTDKTCMGWAHKNQTGVNNVALASAWCGMYAHAWNTNVLTKVTLGVNLNTMEVGARLRIWGVRA